MSKKLRCAAVILAVILCLGPVPSSARAPTLYFTSVNDNLLPLGADTMPFWYGGGLYVPYDVFDSRVTGIDLGLSCGYGRDRNMVSIFNLRRILTFDLTTGTCWNDQTREPVSGGVTARNGRIFVSLSAVCSFFGLTYTYSAIPFVTNGYLVRIKSGAVVLSDAKFMDAASDLIRRRLREYNQSGEPAPAPTPAPAAPASPPAAAAPGSPEEDPAARVATYLAFRCESGEGVPAILDALEGEGACGLFFLTPGAVESEGDLARQILGRGHCIGLLARGEEPSRVQAELEEGRRLLEGSLHQRVTLACVPAGMGAGLREDGWICWNETLALAPEGGMSAGTFAANTLRRLSGRTADTFLTLDAGAEAAQMLPTLLRRLAAEDFVVGIPVETRI